MSKKYYRLVKDHPLWEVGAILKQQSDSSGYAPISDIWDKLEECGHYVDGRELVENQPEWYERVYEISVLGKAKYLSKTAARKAHDTLYKEK